MSAAPTLRQAHLYPDATDASRTKSLQEFLLASSHVLRYIRQCAVVVVEGVIPATVVTGAITMLIIGILLNIVGLGVICWALFGLAVYALPFFVGLTAGMYAHQNGIGPIGAIVVGIAAGGFALSAGRYVFSAMRSPAIRLVVALLFAVPAACAGYHLTLGLAHVGINSEGWRDAIALVGAITIGCTAWARVSILATPVPRHGVGSGSAQSPLGPSLRSVTTEG